MLTRGRLPGCLKDGDDHGLSDAPILGSRRINAKLHLPQAVARVAHEQQVAGGHRLRCAGIAAPFGGGDLREPFGLVGSDLGDGPDVLQAALDRAQPFELVDAGKSLDEQLGRRTADFVLDVFEADTDDGGGRVANSPVPAAAPPFTFDGGCDGCGLAIQHARRVDDLLQQGLEVVGVQASGHRVPLQRSAGGGDFSVGADCHSFGCACGLGLLECQLEHDGLQVGRQGDDGRGILTRRDGKEAWRQPGGHQPDCGIASIHRCTFHQVAVREVSAYFIVPARDNANERG